MTSLLPKKEDPKKCRHDSVWMVKCAKCGYEFDWSASSHPEQYDEVHVRQQANRTTSMILIYEIDDYLRSMRVTEKIRQRIHDHMKTSAIQLGFIQKDDLEEWDERSEHTL